MSDQPSPPDSIDIDAIRLAIQLARHGPPDFWHGRMVVCRKPGIKAMLGYLLETRAI